MQSILVTGSSGRLGGKFIKILLETTEYKIIAVASSKERVDAMKAREKIKDTERLSFMSNDFLVSAETSLPELYGAVHLAFSRRNQSASRIADSIDFSEKVFEKLASSKVGKIINVSSQGVYGSTKEIRTEETVVAPDNHYTMAKYATEVIFNAIFSKCEDRQHTNLRLDIVAQSNHLIQALCRQAREGTIHLRGGEQVFSFIDEDDAVNAIKAMLDSNGSWKREYNVGWNRKRYTLLEVAKEVSQAADVCGFTQPAIDLEKQDIKLWAGMDSLLFSVHTGWNPQLTLGDSLKRMIMELKAEDKSQCLK